MKCPKKENARQIKKKRVLERREVNKIKVGILVHIDFHEEDRGKRRKTRTSPISPFSSMECC